MPGTTKDKKWFEVRLEVAPALEEAVSNRLFELGAEGVNQQITPGEAPTLSGFFETGTEATVRAELGEYFNSLAALFPQQPRVTMQILPVESQNWAERYKEFYRPQPLGHHFYLTPAWEKNVEIPDGRLPIVMEPGQAFGTGLHPSTQLCIGLIERVLKHGPEPSQLSLIDVGTGTGILAIVARKLGVTRVTAIDIDPLAVEAARENFALNQCDGIDVSERPLGAFREPFDIVVSNILLETHQQLVDEYQRLVKRGGTLILSGLLTPQKEELDLLFQNRGFVLELSESWQEWLALMYVRHN